MKMNPATQITPAESADPSSEVTASSEVGGVAELDQIPEQAVTSSTPGRGAGLRLVSAFVAVESFPVSSALGSRARVLATSADFRPAELAAVIGADLGLALAVIRRGGRLAEREHGTVAVEAAVDVLGPDAISDVVSRLETFDPLAINDASELAMQRARAHALQVRDCAIEIAEASSGMDVNEVAIVALMHDLGRIVVSRLHPDYDPESEFARSTPAQRLRRERKLYGIDHALVGGLLARRWDLPKRIAFAVERHHQPGAGGLAEVVGLADQIAHHRAGDAISMTDVLDSGKSLGVGEETLRHLLSGPRVEAPIETIAGSGPCPLSDRELAALHHLADGKVYKQIADDMGVSVSTIRSHLHNVYGKLEVVDRAQAVLKATQSGWL